MGVPKELDHKYTSNAMARWKERQERDDTSLHAVTIPMTPGEYREISAAAESEGMDITIFMRIAALQLARGSIT
jgi:uncharacterized protein (DUF1778 family)